MDIEKSYQEVAGRQSVEIPCWDMTRPGIKYMEEKLLEDPAILTAVKDGEKLDLSSQARANSLSVKF